MAQSEHYLHIKAGRTEARYWRDLWRYRELFYFLAWRDILVRYKQTVIGIAWAPIRPLLTFDRTEGAGLWLCSLNVQYRDFRYIVPFIVPFGLYISPARFSSSIVLEKWRRLYSLNRMIGVIDGFRWAILGDDSQIYLPGFSYRWRWYWQSLLLELCTFAKWNGRLQMSYSQVGI